MMHVPYYSCVVSYPQVIIMLDLRRTRKNRKQRRHYGKQHRWDELAGKLSPKEMREAGL